MGLFNGKYLDEISALSKMIESNEVTINNLEVEVSLLKDKEKKLKEINKNLNNKNENLNDKNEIYLKVLNKLLTIITPADKQIIEVLSMIEDINIKDEILPILNMKLVIDDIEEDISKKIASIPRLIEEKYSNYFTNFNVNKVSAGTRESTNRYTRNSIDILNVEITSKYRCSISDAIENFLELIRSLFEIILDEERIKLLTTLHRRSREISTYVRTVKIENQTQDSLVLVIRSQKKDIKLY